MTKVSVAEIRRQLKEQGSPEIAKHSAGFFKTGPGEYAEGDKFIGVRVPVLRKIAKENRDWPLSKTLKLLHSNIHEERLLAVIILVNQFKSGDEEARNEIFDTYCENFEFVNNWDLVDTSAHVIVAGWLRERSRKLLYRLAKSDVIWERRIAIITTLGFIKEYDFDDALEISEVLLNDEQDLIHKAVGWMLREVGNRDLKIEEAFLKLHYKDMPRTMLRYAIEKFPEAKRKRYLLGKA